ncbi:hypothetical protein ABEF93_002141 [Exophiala dermatitidis]
MNPQQFQNMAGMGPGMPPNMQQKAMVNQMGPQMTAQSNAQMAAQMAQMGMGQMGQMGGQMGMQMPRGMPQQMTGQMGLNQPSVQQHIFDMLNAQGPFSGWQANVQIKERAAQIKLLVDSLRLVRPPVELPRAIEVALQFERKCFTQCASKEDYIRECSEKLGRIRDQRAQQMNQGAAGMMQNMPMGMPNAQMQNQNMQQMQQMQQMGQNMNSNMGLQPNLQQIKQYMQNSPMFNQAQPVMNQGPPKMNPAQQTPMMQANNQQKPTQVPELTAEDNKTINVRAAELAKSTPKDEMRNIVEKMNLQLRQNLAQKGIDPIIYYFRMLATKEFRRRKQMEAGLGGGANVGQVNNNVGMMSQPQNQNNQNPMNQGANANGNTFVGDMGRFQGLQAEGLRSQEEGQLVVPASNSQNMIPEQMRVQQQMLANQRMGQQHQSNALNPAFIAQQQRLQQAQATKVQQAQLQAQNQAQAQAQAQARAQAAAQAQMAGQRGQVQGIPQSSTPLSAINRPVGPNVSGASPQTAPRAPSSTPVMNQQQMQTPGPAQQGQQPQMSMQEMQQREKALANFPAPLQAVLRQKPQSEWRGILQQFQQSGNMRRSLSQQPAGMQPQQQQQGQLPPQAAAPMQNGAFVGGPNVGPMPMQQSLSTGAVSQGGQDMAAMLSSQGQVPQNQDLMRQRQMQMQQQQSSQQQVPGHAQGQMPSQRPQLNPQQMKVMDQQPVPPTFLANIRQHTPIPELKSWGQLKQWLTANPTPNLPFAQILDIQATHFAHIMKTRGQNVQQQNNAMGGQGPTQPPQQTPRMPQGQGQGVPGQAPGMAPSPMQFRPPSAQDLQRLRAHNPKLASLGDDQIRQLWMSRQRQMQQQKGMQQQSGQPGMAQPMQFMPSQGSGPGQQFGVQTMAQPHAPMQPNAAAVQQPPRPPSAQASEQARPSQPNGLPVKRTNEEEVANAPKQMQNQVEGIKFPNGQVLTKEQFYALDPVKKQQYINLQRQQATVRRIFEIGKEVQASMPKPRPIMNMDAGSRKRLTSLLTSDNVKNMLGRFDSFLMALYRIEPNDSAIKQLVAQKLQLFAQYKPQSLQNRAFEVVDNFSISPETAESIVNNISSKFQQTAAQIPLQNKARPQPAQLTPENLSLLEAQEQERKKSLKSNQPPPAPTATQPPFQIGDPRGQGTPRYATPGLKQEDLKLPADPKRRKKNQQQTTGPQGTSGTPTSTTSPQATKASKPADMFKCPVAGCEHQAKGFPSQAELDQHHNVAHKLDMEPVTDPVAFLHESLRSAFNLDENLKQIKKPKSEKQPSAALNVKGESHAATPTAMSKIPSQQGAPGTTAAKATGTEDDNDPWQHSNTSLDQLRAIFGGDDWEELFPSREKTEEFQARFYEAYRNQSERWRKIVEGPNGALTDTSTEKSKSPGNGSDKDGSAESATTAEDKKNAAATAKKGSEDDSWIVNLDGIEGLDLSGLEDTSPFENIGDLDVVMGEDGSPFESIEKPGQPPQLSIRETQLRNLGVDIQHPENWTEQEKAMAEFVLDD